MKIELFAREKVDGWDCWGNEIESTIQLTKTRKYDWLDEILR